MLVRLRTNLTLKAKAVELAGDVRDEALRASAKAKFGNQVTDHGVQGFIVGFDCFWPQHMLPQEAPHRLPLLPLTRNTEKKMNKRLKLEWCCNKLL